jgi:hypothetical protein
LVNVRDPSSPRFAPIRGEGSEAVSRPWPSYGRARCRPGTWSSCARTTRRVPGSWCSDPVTGVMPRGGPLPEDSRVLASVGAVPGEPCAAAVVRPGLAAGRGRNGRAGGRRRMRRACGGPAGVPHTTAGGWVRRFRARPGSSAPGSRRWRWSWAGCRAQALRDIPRSVIQCRTMPAKSAIRVCQSRVGVDPFELLTALGLKALTLSC